MPGSGMGAFADYLAISVENDGTDSRIGMGGAVSRRQFEGPAHVGVVVSTTQRTHYLGSAAVDLE